MDQRQDILLETGALPTAPFVEHAVNSYIRRFVESRGRLSLEADRWGNLLVRCSTGRRRRGRAPLCFMAHTDHPGFVAERMSGRTRLRARWFGGVGLEFFKDADVRFYVLACDEQSPCRIARVVPGRITRVQPMRQNGEARPRLRKRPQSVDVEVAEPVPPGTPGMWYLPDPRIARGEVTARAHDDLAQVAAMLCLLDELCRGKVKTPGEVICAFTRAEEVGFAGAIGLAKSRVLPIDTTFVSLECSSASAAGAKLGDGPILRVGDLTTTFDQMTLAWMANVAGELAEQDKTFHYQRRLMPGGSCEATALSAFSYTAGAMCLPLGNYHNMPDKGDRVASEVIRLDDFNQQVDWMLAMAGQGVQRLKAARAMVARLNKRFGENRPLLRQWPPPK